MHDHRLYRALTRLYPNDFRDHYRDDLVQHHADLIGERGIAAAWARTGLDLLVTVPRYRLETTMNNRHSATALNVVIGLVAAGVASFVVAPLGVALVIVAAIIAITQRSALARAIDTPRGDHRRRNRLITAAVLAAVFGAMVADALRTEDWGNKAIVYNLVGFPALIGAVAFLIAGLFTPTDRTEHPTHSTPTP